MQAAIAITVPHDTAASRPQPDRVLAPGALLALALSLTSEDERCQAIKAAFYAAALPR
jgi:hypothetical protein